MICWCDIETTGLLADRGVILEIACVFAPDKNPTEILAVHERVLSFNVDEWAASSVLSAACPIDDFVLNMHNKNGLWAECAERPDAQSVAVTDREFKSHAAAILPDGEKLIMGGASVGGFDLQWIRHHMPEFAALFSHQVLDITPIKMFCYDLGMPGTLTAKREKHRAFADVEEEIEHYSTCFEWVQRQFKEK